MSTNISHAWHTGKSEPIFNLVQLAQQVQKIQDATRANDIAQSVILASGPWLSSTLAVFGDDDADECAVIIGQAIYPIMQQYAWESTWTFPNKERAGLLAFLSEHLQEKHVDNRKECLADFEELCESIYEFTMQSSPSLCFLSPPDGSDVYIKGFGLTKASVQFLDEQYMRFEYTDACNMTAENFPELKEQAQSASDKDAFFSKAQFERGALWDAAFNGHFVWKDAGLTFSLDNTNNRANRILEIRKVAKIVFAEAKGGRKS